MCRWVYSCIFFHFCSVIAYFGAYLTFLPSVIATIHESAFSYLEIVHSALWHTFSWWNSQSNLPETRILKGVICLSLAHKLTTLSKFRIRAPREWPIKLGLMTSTPLIGLQPGKLQGGIIVPKLVIICIWHKQCPYTNWPPSNADRDFWVTTTNTR